jgi:uncharacterized protein YjbJ (UPF0337 family)
MQAFDVLGVRQIAEQSFEHVKDSFDEFISTTQKTLASLDQQAADVRQKTIGLAASTVANSLEFGQRLMHARNMKDMIQVQTEFMEAQMHAFTEQTLDLGQKMTSNTSETVRTALGSMQSAMSWDQMEANWKQLRGKVKEKWGRLTDDDLEEISGSREKLEGKIRNRYGQARDQIRKDVDAWWRAMGV